MEQVEEEKNGRLNLPEIVMQIMQMIQKVEGQCGPDVCGPPPPVSLLEDCDGVCKAPGAIESLWGCGGRVTEQISINGAG